MKKINYILILLLFFSSNTFGNNFDDWKNQFKQIAISNKISEQTFDLVMKDVKFLPKVIEYDRYQPEFYEDTKTYIDKRTSKKKLEKGLSFFNENKDLINTIEKDFNIEKELLLSLMGIETNFGTYVGKMDILSSLATLSYDKRRSEFFTSELILLLKLIDLGIVDKNKLYGSWAGAFGNFQFMPSTITNYAIDYDSNNQIDLKSIDDSFGSAANYLNKLGWQMNSPCFYKINLKKNTPPILLNTSAKKIKNKKKIKYLKKYIVNSETIIADDNLLAAFVTPDSDIIEDSKLLEPAYLVFNNYELILKWNRSLRFALAVCTLKNKFKNEL